MASNFKALDLVLEIICANLEPKGITYDEIHAAYFDKARIRLSDLQLKPLVDQLLSDKHIALHSLLEGVSYYAANAGAAAFLATGGYQAKAIKDAEMLQKELKIKELELQLQQAQNQQQALEQRKSRKGIYITLVVLLALAVAAFSFLPRSSSHSDPSMADSVAAGTSTEQEPVKINNEKPDDDDANKAQTVDTVILDSVK